MTDENTAPEEQAEPAAEPVAAEPTTAESQQLDAENAEPKTEEKPASDSAGAPRRSRRDKRISQLNERYREQERINQQLKADLDAINKRLGPVPEPARPNPDDFDSREEYEDQLLEWHDNQRQAKQPAVKPEPAAAEIDPGTQQVIDDFQSKLAEIDEDAVDTVMVDPWPCSPAMTEYIMLSDNGAHLALHLATNEDLAGKISQMTPMAAARELVKVEESLGKPQKTTSAPPPPANTAKPSGSSVHDPDKQSTPQWVANRRREKYGAH